MHSIVSEAFLEVLKGARMLPHRECNGKRGRKKPRKIMSGVKKTSLLYIPSP